MTKKFKSISLIKKYSILLILLLTFLFRFYNFYDWVYFGMDQEYEAFIVKNIVTGKHFPMIGVNASDTGLYLGPYFIYFASVPFALFSGNPVGWAITASVLGVVVCYLVYKIGKEMFNQRVGLFASLFYSGSFLASFYDRQFWNPTPVPLFSLLIGFLLFQILNNKFNKLILLAIIFGLSIHIHLSLLIFTPLIIYVIWIKRKEFSKRIILGSILIFILLQLPLILFDLRHNFTNSKALLNLISEKSRQTSSWTNPSKNTFLLSTLGRFFNVAAPADLFLQSGQCKELVHLENNLYPEITLLVIFLIGIFFWYLRSHSMIKHKRHRALNESTRTSALIIGGIILLSLLFVEFYNRQVFEYYFLFLFPWLAITLGLSLEFLWQMNRGKLLIAPIIILFISLNLMTLFTSTYSYSYKDKIEAISFAKKYIQGKNYSLEALGECPRFGGYRYLFEYFIAAPVNSYMDSYFEWIYKDKIKDKKVTRIVLLSMIDPRISYETIARWEEVKLRYLTEYTLLAEKRFDKIQVLIFSTSLL